jgi:hypothetical protein
MKSTALLQRLGFLADLVGWSMPPQLREQLRTAIPKSARATFGRPDRKDGDIGYVADWGLFVHARRDDLLADAPRRRTYPMFATDALPSRVRRRVRKPSAPS